MLRFVLILCAQVSFAAFAQEHEWRAVPLAKPAGQNATPDWFEQIEHELREKESIDVLIEFKTTDLPIAARPEHERASSGERQAAESYAAMVRRNIEAVSRTLESELRTEGVEIVQTYFYQPFMLARINAKDLSRLANSDAIINVTLDLEFTHNDDTAAERKRIQENEEENKPALSTTTTYINVDKAWAKGFRGQGYTVAILDDGILSTHEMFKNGKVVAQACFSKKTETTDESLCPAGASSAISSDAASACQGGNGVCDHGTHVGGIAAGNNAASIGPRRGVAPDANIIPIQVFHRNKTMVECDGATACLTASTSDILAAIDWLIANGPLHKVIAANLSLGGATAYSTYCDSISAYASGINTLRSMGILSVIAAGNDGLTGQVNHPGCIKKAVTVSSTIITVADSSVNHAAIVDLLAPGVFVISAVSTTPTSYGSKSGTSMATPHVTGSIAVLKSKLPAATADQLEYALKATGTAVTRSGWTWSTPRIDVDKALEVVGQNPPPPGIALPSFLPGAYTDGFSYVRLSNPTSISSTASVSVIQDNPKKILGTYTATVPARSSVQIQMKDIETAIGQSGIASSNLSLYIDSNFRGFAQNIVWNATGQSLTNLTVRKATSADPNSFLGNIHTSLVHSYPSYVRQHNGGGAAASAIYDIYDSANGNFIGTVGTPVIEANTTLTLSALSALNAINFNPGTTTYHVNFQLRSSFNGVIAHIIDNTASKLLTDMTAKCPI